MENPTLVLRQTKLGFMVERGRYGVVRYLCEAFRLCILRYRNL